jgi:mono/diheme cytochrome c family protein
MMGSSGSGPAPGTGGSGGSQRKSRIGAVIVGGAFLFLVGAIVAAYLTGAKSPADPGDARQVARGKAVYDHHCASCHGARLEGQPNWQAKLPSGRMPAPPHDPSGHTWHHPDAVLFGITKYGLVPGKYAPPGYQSDMPGFGQMLSDDEIWAVLAYIQSQWPPKIRQAQREINSRRDR